MKAVHIIRSKLESWTDETLVIPHLTVVIPVACENNLLENIKSLVCSICSQNNQTKKAPIFRGDIVVPNTSNFMAGVAGLEPAARLLESRRLPINEHPYIFPNSV